MTSLKFAAALTNAWNIESSKSKFSEVQQFRALMRSFGSLKKPFKLEEFHGMKHQVVFNGKGTWGRPSARCEISDLLIVSYKTKPRFEARATLLQAKKSNEKHTGICSSWPINVAQTSFKANLEQWDLLSRRPNVLPYPPFECQPDILSGALLPSVGSIGVFHKVKGTQYDFFYMSADMAEPLSSPTRKHAKLKTKTGNLMRTISGYEECVFTCCLPTFARALYDLKIGTPIEEDNPVDIKDERYRNSFRGWLKSVLYSHLEMTNNDSELARELLEYLPSDQDDVFMTEPPATVLINCDANEF
ncbi:TPA: hypothetical protein ACN33E_004129 [Vibrio parahaemolyticus]|uniref:hypothetical protein n=1 Tax=Vibrio parahaemolyticus TaxID=670 RepID=UPI00132E83FC|nr:hypothetical protein [Vibrio parahaemolyticus]QHG97998.1 hypothetical protein EHC64_02190 [Vibrio parahaemolyticus]HCE2379153.1 hypothetical protein [Vibrio parahaemolyticus]HCE2588122.1 hypothetical protein [Vibrio parahaemolyticus]